MAHITEVRKGIDILYATHKDAEFKIVEQRDEAGGGFSIFYWIKGPADFLGRYTEGHWRLMAVQDNIDNAIKYIEDNEQHWI